MKPEAAQKPTESGNLWVKVAQISYGGTARTIEWVVSAWFPVSYHVEDESFVEFYQRNDLNCVHHWDSDSEGHVVVTWLPLTPPEETK